jgi:hypothetical protein
MLVNKAQLQTALEIVKPGLASKEIIEQATSFAFMNNRVITYNDEISISHPVEGIDFEGAIKADKLYALLKKTKKEEIDISLNGSEIIIVGGKAKAGLILQSEITLPLEEIAERSKWKALPENFIKFISFCMPSCSKDMSRPTLTCVHIAKEGIIEACDNFSIAQCNLKEELPFEDFLLSASSAVQVVKLNPVKLAEGTGWIHFKNELGTIISCRIYEDKYPDISQFLPIKGNRVVLPQTANDVLERADIFSGGDHILDGSVTIKLEANKFKISARTDDGWFKEEVNMEYDHDPITFSITPYLLKRILSESADCIISKDKLKFQGEGWQYLTMLRYNKE